MPSSHSASELRWTIKPEPLRAENGVEITMGLAYGPAPDEPVEVVPASALAELQRQRDELRFDAELQVSTMRVATLRLKPLARRALTEPGASGDQARRDLHEAIDWIAKGCPKPAEKICAGEFAGPNACDCGDPRSHTDG